MPRTLHYVYLLFFTKHPNFSLNVPFISTFPQNLYLVRIRDIAVLCVASMVAVLDSMGNVTDGLCQRFKITTNDGIQFEFP